MNIAVIIKKIEDKFIYSSDKVLEVGDQIALSIAVKLRENDSFGSSSVSAFCISPLEHPEAMREALCLGADNAYFLADALFQKVELDNLMNIFKCAFDTVGNFDLVLIPAPYKDTMITNLSGQLAKLMNIKHLKDVTNILWQTNKLFYSKVNSNDFYPLALPALINISYDPEQKYYNPIRLMKLYRKEVKILNAEQIGFSIKT
ncbi:MAG: hypothetical protein KatS3mg068_1071 [Candidatus Sericytochromatia bacterium]|nr:MAG: hypothetical protein KatS3mg068_1071 [Candidatus Sericytochromatia bacterium]